jgi:hypothetical protein
MKSSIPIADLLCDGFHLIAVSDARLSIREQFSIHFREINFSARRLFAPGNLAAKVTDNMCTPTEFAGQGIIEGHEIAR